MLDPLPDPPAIVVELPAPCTDVSAAEELLRRATQTSRAPEAGWKVHVRFARRGEVLKAEGTITDSAGTTIAERTLTKGIRECAPLARGLGVWAALVLDVESEQQRTKGAKSSASARASSGKPAKNELDNPAYWPAPAANDEVSPEHALLLDHKEDNRSLEVGITGFIMGGVGTEAIGGPTIFATIEAGHGVFLRPMIAMGRTVSALRPGNVFGTWGATRFDVCARLPGLYLERRGLQLDGCAGADIGFLVFDRVENSNAARTLPFVALGPSLSIRGELGGDLALELRGVVGLNVIRDEYMDPQTRAYVSPPLFGGRGELGMSWRFR